MCHEVHLPGVTNTTVSTHSITLETRQNKSFLRANVDKYVPGAATPAYLHTDQPAREGIPADNPDRAVEGGNDTTARGYCQVCHTMTNYHRSSDTAGADQCHDGASNDSCTVGTPEVNCGACHDHSGSFAGAGGSCTGCHSSQQDPIPRPIITTQFDRLSSHITGGSGTVTPEDCEACHEQSTHLTGAQVVRLYDADDAGTNYVQPTQAASTLASGEGEAFAPACLSCHDSDGATRLAGGVDQTPLSPFTGSAAPPVIDATAWGSASHNRPTSGNPTGTHGPNPVSCLGDGTNGCHGSGHGSEQNSLLAPAAGPTVSATEFCYTCHDSDGPSSINIQAQFNTATDFQVTSASGALINQRHDITAADQAYSGGVVTCRDCHSPHVNNDANPVADPDTGTVLNVYSPSNSYTEDGYNFPYDSGGDLNPANPQGCAETAGCTPTTEPDYIQFCLTCHDGTTPPGVTMSTNLLNLADIYAGVNGETPDQHGTDIGSTGSTTSKGGLKMPWVNATDNAVNNDPTAGYAALNCTTCHGAHGTGNIFNLKTSITVAGAQMQIGGVGNMPVPARISDPTVYTLPPMDGRNVNEATGVQTDHYWGAWCSFCHKMDAHPGKVEADSCTGGHMHGGGAF
jgi:hypothetical protein